MNFPSSEAENPIYPLSFYIPTYSPGRQADDITVAHYGSLHGLPYLAFEKVSVSIPYGVLRSMTKKKNSLIALFRFFFVHAGNETSLKAIEARQKSLPKHELEKVSYSGLV